MGEAGTVYVVDGDQAIRESIATIARSRGFQVEECDSAAAFLGRFAVEGRTCLVVESDLPDMSGLELQERLNGVAKSAPIVMVSQQGSIRTAVQAMQRGAITFLPKPVRSDELSAAIGLALDRSDEQLSATQQVQALRDRFAQLTASERQVLVRVLEGQPNKQIATEMDIGLRTVELRRSHIMRKTEASNLTELIRLTVQVDFPNDLPPPAESAAEAAPQAGQGVEPSTSALDSGENRADQD